MFIYIYIHQSKRRRRAGGKDLSDAADIMSDASLELPSELLNKSLLTVTNISKSLSRLILVSAGHIKVLLRFFDWVLGLYCEEGIPNKIIST